LTYAFDIDCTLTLTGVPVFSMVEKLIIIVIYKFPKTVFFFGTAVRLLPVNRTIRQAIDRYYKNGHRIILITSRPPSLRWVTEHWLEKVVRVPYHQVVFNGDPKHSSKEFKWQMASKYGICLFIDNDEGVVQYFNRHRGPSGPRAMSLREWLKIADCL